MTVPDSVQLIHMCWTTRICQRHCQKFAFLKAVLTSHGLYRTITAHSSVSWPIIISGGTENLSHPVVKSKKNIINLKKKKLFL